MWIGYLGRLSTVVGDTSQATDLRSLGLRGRYIAPFYNNRLFTEAVLTPGKKNPKMQIAKRNVPERTDVAN